MIILIRSKSLSGLGEQEVEEEQMVLCSGALWAR